MSSDQNKITFFFLLQGIGEMVDIDEMTCFDLNGGQNEIRVLLFDDFIESQTTLVNIFDTTDCNNDYPTPYDGGYSKINGADRTWIHSENWKLYWDETTNLWKIEHN